MQGKAARPIRPAVDPRQIQAAFDHLESVAAICRQQRKCRVIPFPVRNRGNKQ